MQWFQLYEIDASLLASVMQALGEQFPHYAIFAPSDYDLLIVASDRPIPLPVKDSVFQQPGLAQEMFRVYALTAGDLDARYLGSRATLEPLFASYGMPLNSDYYPVLDLNAAKQRFLERSASDVVAMLSAAVPVLEMLEPDLPRRPVNPLHKGAHAFERIEQTRLARYARDVLLKPTLPEPEAISTLLEKDLELVKLRLIECRDPKEQDVWLHSLLNVARLVNPYLPAPEASAVWARVAAAPCFATLREYQRQWVLLYAAVAQRDGPHGAVLAAWLLANQPDLSRESREYLLMAGMAGALAAKDPGRALALWNEYHGKIRNEARPVFRLLRCHAQRSEPAACASSFARYADD
ncbi:MAG: hypothetical protein ACRET8_05290 [Burkholderiales bacterium]